MEILITLSYLFVIGGTFGWLTELFFRRIAHGKWVNPGFLSGPCLPLYGIGFMALYYISSAFYTFLPAGVLRSVSAIIALSLIMTAVELLTGLFFVRVMHVRLWDYSDRAFNLYGIICPLFSGVWTVFSAIYFLFLYPILAKGAEWVLSHHIVYYALGIYLGILLVDILYSFRVGQRIADFAREHHMIVTYETLQISVRNYAESIKKNVGFLFTFPDHLELSEIFPFYEKWRERRHKKKDPEDATHSDP